VQRALSRQTILERMTRWGGFSSAAAAILLVGFTFGRWSNHTLAVIPGVPATGVAMNNSLPPQDHISFPVALRDGNGQVVSVPQFPSQRDADAFISQINRASSPESAVEPVSDVTY